MPLSRENRLKRSLLLIDIEEWDEKLLWQLILVLGYKISPNTLEMAVIEVERNYYDRHGRTIADDYYE